MLFKIKISDFCKFKKHITVTLSVHNVTPCHVFVFAVTMRSQADVSGESVRRLLAPPDIRRWSLCLTRDPGELGTLQLQDTAHMVRGALLQTPARLLLVKISRPASARRWWWDDDMILITWAQDTWHVIIPDASLGTIRLIWSHWILCIILT